MNDIGYQSICVPASLRAYRDAHREHGRLPWEQIVEPAIAWAEGGWTVRPHVALLVWAEEGQMGRAASPERLAFTPASRALYCRPDGTPKRVGDRVVNRDLGQTLRLDRQARRRRSSTRARSRTPSWRTCARTAA